MGNLISSVGALALLTIVTNGLGFMRDLLFARAFGAGREADSYIAAFTIVAVCFLVFAAGSLQGAFMPRYQQAIVQKNYIRARELWWSTALVLSIVLCAIALVVFLSADYLVALVMPGFDDSMRETTSRILRIISPMIVLCGLGALFQSILHAHYKFIIPALVPVANNCVLIVVLIFFVPYLGMTAYGVGTLMGASVWLVLFPVVYRQLPQGVLSRFNGDELRVVVRAMVPLLILLVVDQAASLIQKSLVSDLEVGSIAVLNYAAKLEGLPVGIFATAITTAVFPVLVTAISLRDHTATRERFQLGLCGIAFFCVPATFIMVLEPLLVIKPLLERGAFAADTSVRVAEALRWYAIGLLPQSLIVFLNRVYFADGDTTTPMRAGVVSAVIHIVLSWLLVSWMGYLGIAVGTSIYALFYSALLLWRLGRVVREPFAALMAASWRSLIGGMAFLPLFWLVQFPPTLMGLTMCLLLSGIVYISVGFLLRDPVLLMITSRLLGGVRNRSAVGE